MKHAIKLNETPHGQDWYLTEDGTFGMAITPETFVGTYEDCKTMMEIWDLNSKATIVTI